MMLVRIAGMKDWLRSLYIIFIVKVFATQDGQLASLMNMTDNIDPYVSMLPIWIINANLIQVQSHNYGYCSP